MTFIENALNSFASNLGVSFPDLVLIIVVLGSIIIFGLNVRIGLMFFVATMAITYIMFNLVGMPVNNVLIVFMIGLVLLALSFFVKDNRGPGAV